MLSTRQVMITADVAFGERFRGGKYSAKVPAQAS